MTALSGGSKEMLRVKAVCALVGLDAWPRVLTVVPNEGSRDVSSLLTKYCVLC